MLGFTHANAKAADGLAVGDAVPHATWPRTRPPPGGSPTSWPAGSSATTRHRRLWTDSRSPIWTTARPIVPVLRTLFSSVEFWMSTGLKTRRPLENVDRHGPHRRRRRPGAKTDEGIEGLYWMSNQLGTGAAELGSAGRVPGLWRTPGARPTPPSAPGTPTARSSRAGTRASPTPEPETFVGLKPATVGEYIDTTRAAAGPPADAGGAQGRPAHVPGRQGRHARSRTPGSAARSTSWCRWSSTPSTTRCGEA